MFFKKKGKKNIKPKGPIREWLDAVVFAVIAATLIRMLLVEAFTIPTSSMEKSLLRGDYLFVSKLHYGPKTPNTPLSFPFAHHTLPVFNTKSYLEWINLPYFRLPGFADIANNDVVVFNFPEGDTVATFDPNSSYYDLVLNYGRSAVWNNPGSEIIVRPPDKRENYIKRCIAIPNDELQIINGVVHINGVKAEEPEDMQYNYFLKTDGNDFNTKILRKHDITDHRRISDYGDHRMALTSQTKSIVEKMTMVKEMRRWCKKENEGNPRVFPRNNTYGWNEDNYGPITIPKAGITVNLTLENLPIYERLIDLYEGHDLKISGNAGSVHWGTCIDNKTKCEQANS
ncbi:MAG: signal peptidase I [Flavobacteriales bacterium]|nr:signal peptidase I [Flavobacteriales bacterium]